MNAKELLALIDECGMIELVNRSGRDSDGWIQETILRALRLLAAAEANDAAAPDSDAAYLDNGDPSEAAMRQMHKVSRRLERERNGLAARVGELEAERDALKFPRATSQPIGSGGWIIDVPYLKHIKHAIRKTFGDDAFDHLDLEEIEQVLLAVDAYREFKGE